MVPDSAVIAPGRNSYKINPELANMTAGVTNDILSSRISTSEN